MARAGVEDDGPAGGRDEGIAGFGRRLKII